MRFSLKKLLLFILVMGLALALFGGWGIAVTLFLLLQTIWIKTLGNQLSLVSMWALLFVLGTCVIHSHREAYRIVACRNNLKAIGLALHNYHDQYGRFPPQYVADSEGRPMHSWRVLILPYLSEAAALRVYQQYCFDEPWNSPRNQRLATGLADYFRCPTTNTAESGSLLTAHYVAVAGPGTVWPGSKGTCLKDVADGTSQTIALVEIASSDIHCMEPRDVALDRALTNNVGVCDVPSSHHYSERTYFFLREYPLVGNVLMVDGSCRTLAYAPSCDDLAALLTIDGGESIDENAVFRWSHGGPFLGLDVMRCTLFILLLVSFVLLKW